MARRKEAFLVNLWFEPRHSGEAGPETWRGSVEHLATKQRRYFTDFVELLTFLAAHASSAPVEHGRPDADAPYTSG